MKRNRPRGTTIRWLEAAALAQTDECLLWPYAKSDQGYGITHYRGERRYVHHAVLLAVGRELPSKGNQTRHLCGNRACCNVRHLQNGTPAENRADQALHGTEYRGERHHRARLTENDVRAIRRTYRCENRSSNVAELAALYGVTRQSILRVVTRESWRHVEEGLTS